MMDVYVYDIFFVDDVRVLCLLYTSFLQPINVLICARLSWGHRSVSIRIECFNKYASKEEMMKQYVKYDI